jgi:hypothetical protein
MIEGIIGEVKMFSVADGWLNPTLTTWQTALTTGTMPGWFKADGSSIVVPYPGGASGTIVLPNFVDSYPKFGDNAVAVKAGSHVRTAEELPEHKHSVAGLSGTTSSAGDHAHTYNDILKGGSLTGVGAGFIPATYGNPNSTSVGGAHTHTITFPGQETSNFGTPGDMNIEPARVVLVPIIRIY